VEGVPWFRVLPPDIQSSTICFKFFQAGFCYSDRIQCSGFSSWYVGLISLKIIGIFGCQFVGHPSFICVCYCTHVGCTYFSFESFLHFRSAYQALKVCLKLNFKTLMLMLYITHGKGRFLTPTLYVLIGCNVFSLKFLVACMLGSGRPHVGHPHY
jgi:hypothetical protein